MHMSEYLKGVNPETKVSTNQVDTSEIEKMNNELSEKLNELTTKYQELVEKFNDISTNAVVSDDQTEDAGEHDSDVTTKITVQEATIEGLKAQINLLKTKLSISEERHDNTEIKHMLSIIHDELVNGTDRMCDDELTNDEVNEILTYISLIHDKYFSDIPLANDLSKLFVWNISRKMYMSMKNGIDKETPDIINPMFYMFIALSEEPGWMIGRFLNIVSEMLIEESDLIEKMDTEYLESLEMDNEDDNTPLIDSEIISEGGLSNE